MRATPKGDYGKLLRLSVEMTKLSAVVQAYHPEYYAPDEVSSVDPVYAIVCTFHDDLADLSRWIDEALVATQTWLGDVEVRRKIAKLRDPTGRTPEEVKAARRVADRLQRKLGAQLPKGSRV